MGERLDEARAELAAARRRYDVQEAALFGDPGEAEQVAERQREQGYGPDGYALTKEAPEADLAPELDLTREREAGR